MRVFAYILIFFAVSLYSDSVHANFGSRGFYSFLRRVGFRNFGLGSYGEELFWHQGRSISLKLRRSMENSLDLLDFQQSGLWLDFDEANNLFYDVQILYPDAKGWSQYKEFFPLLEGAELDADFLARKRLLNYTYRIETMDKTPWGKIEKRGIIDVWREDAPRGPETIARTNAIHRHLENLGGMEKWERGAALLGDIHSGARFYPHPIKSTARTGRDMMQRIYSSTIGRVARGQEPDPRALERAVRFLEHSPGASTIYRGVGPGDHHLDQFVGQALRILNTMQ